MTNPLELSWGRRCEMKLTLYHYWRSSSSWRVRWALEIKGVKAAFTHVDLLSGEVDREPHLSRNPMGYVPVLEADGRMLIESMAILEWLEETHPSPQLMPGDAFERAHIRALCEIINAGTQPIQNLPVLDFFSDEDEKRREWAQYFIRRGLSAFQAVAAPRAGRHCVGDRVTAADIFLIPQCYNARRFGMDPAEFPLIERLFAAAMETEACKRSAPEKFQPK